MTTEISDAARDLVRGVLRSVALATMPHDDNPLELAQTALNAARNSALEDAAKACDRVMNNKEFNEPSARRTAGKCASEIRAMKVQI